VPTTAHLDGDTDGMLTDNTATLARDDVAQHIIDLIGKDDEIVGLTTDSSLQSHGLDSLKIMSLVFTIEEHYDILLDEEDADDLRTVGDLAALVLRRVGDRS
jgi:acyl carrier protein